MKKNTFKGNKDSIEKYNKEAEKASKLLKSLMGDKHNPINILDKSQKDGWRKQKLPNNEIRDTRELSLDKQRELVNKLSLGLKQGMEEEIKRNCISFGEWLSEQNYQFIDNTIVGNLYTKDETGDCECFTMEEIYKVYKEIGNKI